VSNDQTPIISRARREAVAAALWSTPGNGMFARMHPEGFASRPEYVKRNYRADADAALAVMLPDRAVFERQLERLICVTEDFAQFYTTMSEGRIPENEQTEYKRLSDIQDKAEAALIALVYGADDAQAGDQEGAEHE